MSSSSLYTTSISDLDSSIGCSILLPLAIESAWNTYPATKLSSLILLLAHLIMLAGLYASKADDAFADDFRVDEKDLDRQMASRYARKTRST